MRALLAIAVTALSAALANAASAADLWPRIVDLEPGGRLPASAAFCRLGTAGKQVPGENKSLGLSWTAGPEGTRSYAVLMTDPDVPADLALLGKPAPIPLDAPRQRIFHWVLVDIPPSRTSLAEGEDSSGVTPGGKPVGVTGHGTRGHNTYQAFFANDPAMLAPMAATTVHALRPTTRKSTATTFASLHSTSRAWTSAATSTGQTSKPP
jgi:phosphatidylethanolamine-binding protein (PEBP) family uncharacterized protein